MGQGWFESNEDYEVRMRQEAAERVIENSTGSAPRQGWFESGDSYRSRISQEANEHVIEISTGSAPSQGWFESSGDYQTRLFEEANARIVEDNTGSAPRQGIFESGDEYRSRVFREANESVIERSDGAAPRQGWFEGDEAYRRRIALEARERKSRNRPEETQFYSDISRAASRSDVSPGYDAGDSTARAESSSNDPDSRAGPLASLRSALSLAAEVRRSGGRLVRPHGERGVEVITIDGGSSGFSIVTTTYADRDDYEAGQRLLAEGLRQCHEKKD
jgi:hypothetical protein